MLSASSILQSVLSLSTVATTGPPNLVELFGPSLSSGAQILSSTDSNFSAQLTQRWTDYNAPSYIGAIKPATERDTQNIVKIAADNEIPFFATGGGHGTSNYSAFNGLSIDMSNFRSVELDPAENLLTVGSAVKVGQLVDVLYENGKELALGSCECVGIVGATLGGGIGSLQGVRGLLLDALQSVRIVTAQGAIIEASSTANPDLFWAIRGAGSSFGIVISATYRVYDVSNNGQVMNADFVYPASANRSFFEVMKSFDNTMPPELGITGVAFFNRSSNEPVIAVNAVYYGPQSDGEQYVQPFKDLEPTMSNISTVTSREMMDAAFFSFFGADNGACTPNQHINIYTVGLKEVHVPSFESVFANLTDFWNEYPDYQGRLLLQRYSNEAVQAVPEHSTAYGQRDIKTYVNIESFYTDPTIDDAVDELAASGRMEIARNAGFDTFSVYSNYARGDEGPEAWYSPQKLPRLAELKRRWDPEELFSVHNPVPLRWP